MDNTLGVNSLDNSVTPIKQALPLSQAQQQQKELRQKQIAKNHQLQQEQAQRTLNKTQTLAANRSNIDISVLHDRSTFDQSPIKASHAILNNSRHDSLTSRDIQDLQRAFSTYLNATGPGQYALPNTTYGKQIMSNKRNSPMFSIKSKTKLPYFPQCYTEFQGKDSPPCAIYSPDNSICKKQDPSVSIGKFERFHQNVEEVSLKRQIPCSYSTNVITKADNRYKQIALGYGSKLSYKTGKEDEENPGPNYQTEYLQSIQQKVDHTESRKDSTFGCDKEQQAKIMYPGQERHYYGMQSPGPGNYCSTDAPVALSSVRAAQHFSIPKNDRGLLRLKKNDQPSPNTYQNSTDIFAKTIAKKDGAFSMPRSERKFNFAKFNSMHSILVQKGLH